MNDFVWYGAILLGLLVTFLLRLLPGILWPRPLADMGYHLLLCREIRRAHWRVPLKLDALMLDKRQTYPWLYHWLLAFLPQSLLLRVAALPSAIIDTLHALLVFGWATWLATTVYPQGQPFAIGLLAMLLFSTSPALLAVGLGPRAYDITPRPFGELIYSMVMISAAFYLHNDGAIWAGVVAILSASLLLLSSKFAAQVLLFCVPIMAGLTREWLLLSLLPLAVVGALLLSGGRYWWMLTGQIAHLRLYRNRLQYDHPGLQLRNQSIKLWRTVQAFVRSGLRDTGLRAELIRLIEANVYLQFFSRNVLWIGVILFILLGVFPAWQDDESGWYMWLLSWSVAPIFPFMLTAFKDFRFLGEAERYPEYAILPVAVLGAFGIGAMPFEVIRGLLFTYGLLTIAMLAYYLFRRRWQSSRVRQPKHLTELQEFVKDYPQDTVILGVPMPQVTFALAYQVPQRFLMAMDTLVWFDDYDKLFHKYPWPSLDFHWWRDEHGVQLLIVEERWLSTKLGCEWTYDFTSFQEVFRNDAYRVYQTT
ncbi:MAG: hypothetical protein AAF702_25065 [Chloroflexota bacterium]